MLHPPSSTSLTILSSSIPPLTSAKPALSDFDSNCCPSRLESSQLLTRFKSSNFLSMSSMPHYSLAISISILSQLKSQCSLQFSHSLPDIRYADRSCHLRKSAKHCSKHSLRYPLNQHRFQRCTSRKAFTSKLRFVFGEDKIIFSCKLSKQSFSKHSLAEFNNLDPTSKVCRISSAMLRLLAVKGIC
jgi:hypothetical protein